MTGIISGDALITFIKVTVEGLLTYNLSPGYVSNQKLILGPNVAFLNSTPHFRVRFSTRHFNTTVLVAAGVNTFTSIFHSRVVYLSRPRCVKAFQLCTC